MAEELQKLRDLRGQSLPEPARTQEAIREDVADQPRDPRGNMGTWDQLRKGRQLRHLMRREYGKLGQRMPTQIRDVLSENPDWDAEDLEHWRQTQQTDPDLQNRLDRASDEELEGTEDVMDRQGWGRRPAER